MLRVRSLLRERAPHGPSLGVLDRAQALGHRLLRLGINPLAIANLHKVIARRIPVGAVLLNDVPDVALELTIRDPARPDHLHEVRVQQAEGGVIFDL